MIVRRAATMVLAAVLGTMGLSVASAAPSGAAHATELGVNVAIYDQWPDDADALAAADQTFSYLEGLGATAVALNFFFGVDGSSGTTVSAEPGFTPSPSLLGSMIDDAASHGLAVELRPLLDETTVAPQWRGSIHPSDPAAWFASYRAFLAPYVALASSHPVHRFVLAAELVSMIRYGAKWQHVIREVSATTSTTHTQLSVDGNWWPVVGVPGIGYGMDFYQPVIFPDGVSPSVRHFQAAMASNLAGTFTSPGSTPPVPLRQLVLSEVGLAAVRGAWNQPYNTFAGQPVTIARKVQAHWFTAACQTAKAEHLRGIYFWAVFLAPGKSPTEDDSASPYEWVGTASADAIRACFTAP